MDNGAGIKPYAKYFCNDLMLTDGFIPECFRSAFNSEAKQNNPD